jgi:hypothetical protein
MKRFLAISILLTVSIFPLYAQNAEENKESKQQTEKKERVNAIIVAPFNVFNSVAPNIQLGYCRVVAPRWAVQLEGAIIINFSIVEWWKVASKTPHTYKGFRVKMSAKYFVYPGKYFKIFLSPELFYYNNKSGMSQYFWKLDNDFKYPDDIPEWAPGYFQYFYNHEQKIGINFMTGFWVALGKCFFIESHIGIGVAYRMVTHTGRINQNDKIYARFGIFDNASLNKIGLTIPVDLKFGFRF